ncbi:hypothetical protein [Autumnicola edwardsiae]|uniref:Uncharacterized protein n=1 Tax=Autumnicola edwardsiae TaxID=3075594 RepID=A0ABU3CRR8_9FLAO|nr:hypothetical protein [Zunongwangia sp. F297]MDT0649053.1 hypothetical protein [Zunongwangia sp. F297]
MILICQIRTPLKVENWTWRGISSEEIGARRMNSDIQDYIDEVFKNFPL